MRSKPQHLFTTNIRTTLPGVLVAACVLLMLAVFAFDASTPRGVAAGLPYVLPVLLGLWLPWRFAPLVLAVIATALTVLGFLLKAPQGALWVALFNRALILGGIWFTALVCQMQIRAAKRLSDERQRIVQLQAELYRIARRSELGGMVGAIAHELNQPLAATYSYVAAARRGLQREHVQRAEVEPIMEKALRQAERAGQVIRQIRRITHDGDTERTIEDLNAVIEEAVSLALVGTRQQSIRATLELASDSPHCLIHRTQIQQVLLHLVRNSVEALDGCPRRELRVSSRRTGDGLVQVSVADTGPGLPEEVKARLFMPFLTTKPRGVGVGLSIAQSIIEAHSGRLSASAGADGGTVFSFTLRPVPVAQAPAVRPPR